MEYKESNFIQTAKPGEYFGTYHDYKYRVLGRSGYPTHHTNDLKDAQQWFRKCVEHWKQTDNPNMNRTV